jgi:hypothetical protein
VEETGTEIPKQGCRLSGVPHGIIPAGVFGMSMIIRAHFDGKTIVPDTGLDLPTDQALEVEVRLLPAEETTEHAVGETDVASLPFFGMWADRKDMRDSAAWVRKERESWSSRLTGTD